MSCTGRGGGRRSGASCEGCRGFVPLAAAGVPPPDVWRAEQQNVLQRLVSLAAVSVQDMLPNRPLLRTFAQVFRVRDVASFDVGQLFKPPKSTQDQAPTKASAVKVGFPRRSEPARHAAAPTTCFELLLNWSLSSFPTPRRDNPASSGVCHLRQRVPWLGWSSNPRTLP